MATRAAARLLLAAALAGVGCRDRRAAAPADLAPAAPSLLGGERGVDHVGLAVTDLRAAARTFQQRLGFERPIPGHLPNGIDNVNFYFEDATYLELLTCYDRQKADWLAWFLDRYTEGGNFVVLSVASAADTAAFLRGRGVPTEAPSAGSIEIQGGRPGGTWRTLFFQRSPLPGSPLYFIEYPRDARADFLRKLEDREVRRLSFRHRNTAVGIRAVWLAVRDLEGAAAAYAAIGLERGPAVSVERLGARGVAFRAGLGQLLLLSPTAADGPVAAFLGRRGPGVLGMSIEVRDLAAAQRAVSEGTGRTLAAYAGPLGRSILVEPQDAHGAYLELFQAAPR